MQKVSLYPVFATLIIPARAIHRLQVRRLLKACAVAVTGYASSLTLLLWCNLLSGALIVCVLAAAGSLVAQKGAMRAPALA